MGVRVPCGGPSCSRHRDPNPEPDRDLDQLMEDEASIEDDMEFVLLPHPTEMTEENQLVKLRRENTVMYIKTTAKGSVGHLISYLSGRLTRGLDPDLLGEDAEEGFTVYLQTKPGNFTPLSCRQELWQINDRPRKINSPMNLYYSWKML